MIQITGFDDDAWQPLGPPRCDTQVLSDSSVSTVLGFRIGPSNFNIGIFAEN